MPSVTTGPRLAADFLDRHRRIIWALLMRELSTRYGRDDLGFLWVVLEPMIFASAVSVLWSVIKPPFESGIRIIPFTITGYLPLILVRQSVGYAVGAIKVNRMLLYHRQITPLHLFLARVLTEFFGVSLAYIVIVTLLSNIGLMPLPKNMLSLIGGWVLLSWLAMGLALIMGALSEIFEFVERFVQVITYILVPLSGAFFLASSLPYQYRHWILFIPFIHCFELMRSGYFGDIIHTYYNIPYVMSWAAGMTLFGLILLQFVRGHIEVE